MSTDQLSLTLYAVAGTLVLLFVVLSLTGRALIRALREKHEVETDREHLEKHWRRTQVEILSVAYNHPWYDIDLKPRGYTQATGDPEAMERVIDRAMKTTKKRLAIERQRLVNIQYRYRQHGRTYRGHRLAPRLYPGDEARVYDFKPGEIADAYINPQAPHEAYLLAKSPAADPALEQRIHSAWMRIVLITVVVVFGSAVGYATLV